MTPHYDSLEELWDYWIAKLPDNPSKQVRDQIVVAFIVMIFMIVLTGFPKKIINRSIVIIMLYVLQGSILHIIWRSLPKVRGKRRKRRKRLINLLYMGCGSEFCLILAVSFLYPSLTAYTYSAVLITQITTLAILVFFGTLYVLAFAFSSKLVSKYFIPHRNSYNQQDLTRAIAIQSAMVSVGILVGTIFGRGNNPILVSIFIGLAFIIALILLPYSAIYLSQMVLLIRLSIATGSEEQT